MIAIIAPDRESVAHLLTKVTIINDHTIEDKHFITVRYGTYVFLIVISGYGKVNISCAVTLACKSYSIHSLLGIGTAGTLCKCRAPMGSAVICEDTLQYDVNFCALGEKPFTLPHMKDGVFHASKEMAEKAKQAAKKAHLCAREGRIVSDDRFVACALMARRLRCCYCGLAVDAECGALGQIAHFFKLPFTTIKVIADDAGCCAARQFCKCGERASKMAQEAALEYIKLLASC